MVDRLLSLLADHDLSLRDFSAADREFLRAVYDEGDARTQDIRSYGLDRQQIHYRYDSLADDGLIDVSRVGVEDHDGRKQNVATLTEFGDQLVEAGLLDEVTDANTNLEELNRRIDGLIDDVNDAIKDLNSDYQKLYRRIDRLEERVEESG